MDHMRLGRMDSVLVAAACAWLLVVAGCGSRPAPATQHSISSAAAEAEEFKQSFSRRGPNPTGASNPALSSETRPYELGEKTSLEAVLRSAAANSPEAAAARSKWEASTYRKGQVFTLPDPKLMFTYYVRMMMPADREWEIGLSQEIPYPGSLVIAGKMADREAQAAYLRYQAAVRDAIAMTKEAFFELHYIDRARQVTGEIAKLYDRYAALAAGGDEKARPKLPETFRAEALRAQLANDLIVYQEMRAATEEKLRAAAGLPAGAALGPVEDVADPAPLTESLVKLQERAEAANQELAAAGLDVERAQLQTRLARRAPIPSLMLGAGYMRTGDMPGEKDPTKDMVMLNVGFSLPIWFGKYIAQAREARAMEAAARQEADAWRLKLRAELAEAFFRLNNSSRLTRLYRDTLLPQARQALQSAEELYRRGEANLASVLETTATVHSFELAALRAKADFYQNVARVEKLVGTALELRPRAGPEADVPPVKEGAP